MEAIANNANILNSLFFIFSSEEFEWIGYDLFRAFFSRFTSLWMKAALLA
jgi:hypothetical protein